MLLYSTNKHSSFFSFILLHICFILSVKDFRLKYAAVIVFIVFCFFLTDKKKNLNFILFYFLLGVINLWVQSKLANSGIKTEQ